MKNIGKALFGSNAGGGFVKPVDDTLARVETEAEIERKRLLSEQAARQRAARRGGYRALLSQERFAPETGLQTTLGVG
jgi:hypothetical protein